MLKRHRKVLAGIGLVVVACLLSMGIKLVFADTSPAITSVAPAAGNPTGGDTIVLTGTNFRDFSSSATMPATANAWSAASNTTTAQQGQTATAVINGKIYIYGGNVNGTAIQVADVSDPTSFTTSPNALPANVSGASVIRIGDKLYIYSDHILTANVSDPTTWQDLGAMPVAKPFARQVMIIGDKIYLFGAGASSNAIYTAPVSDPTALTDTGATLPGVRMFASFFNDGTYVYMLGGETDTSTWCRSNVNTIYRAPLSDPTSWTDTGKTLPVALATAVPVVLGDTAYLIGGCTPAGGANVNTVYSASLSDLTTWTDTGKTLPAALGNSGSVIANGNIYVYGGINDSGTAVGAIYYAPLTQTGINYDNVPWTTDLPSPLTGVTFGGTAATNVEYINDTAILATAPAHTVGTVDVSATDGTQTATLASGYTYLGPPEITSLTPASGVAGDVVDIFGSDFDSAATVQFGNTAANVTWIDSTHLQVVVPASVYGGTVSISVTNPGSPPTTLSNAFSYIGGTVTWTGATSTDWNTASNWNAGFVPGPNENVIINGGTRQPTLNLSGGPVTILGLTLGSSAASTLTEQNGSATNKLTVTNDMTIGANGMLTHTANTNTQTSIVSLNVGGNLSIAASGKISADGKGYAAGQGIGAGGAGACGSNTSGLNDGGGAGGGGGYVTKGQAGGKGYGTTGAGGTGGAQYTGSGSTLSDLFAIGSGGGAGKAGYANDNGTCGGGAGGAGGAGGGGVIITANALALNGSISANGVAGGAGGSRGGYGAGGGGGGGAGGTVKISVAASVTGSGSLSANGGAGGAAGTSYNNNNGGVGGAGSSGRIALTYATSAFSGTYSANSATSAGTIFTQATGTNGNLVLDNGVKTAAIATILPFTPLTFDTVTVTKGAALEIPSGKAITANAVGTAAGTGANSGSVIIDNGGTWNIPTTVTLSGYVITNNGTLTGGTNTLSLTNTTWNQNGTSFPSGTSLTVGASSTITFADTMTPMQALNLNSLTVQSGGTITTAANTTTATSTLNFNVTGSVDVQAGGTINLDGKGYSTNNGAGKPASGNAGGSYGGTGGIGNTAGTTAGPTYGDQTQPTDMGSGGSNGAGGGALKLVSQNGINVNGTITANGAATNGSGGSIWLTGSTITGTGTIRANGAGSGTTVGGGAGGRIAFTYTGDPLSLDSLNGATGDRSGGDTLTLTGSNFSAGTKVLIGGVNATATLINDHTLSVIVPAVNTPQTVDVTVYDQTFTGAETVTGATGYTTGGTGTIYPTEMPGSQTATQLQSYTYTQANPVISSVSPTVGPSTGGNNVLISGQAFDSFGRTDTTPATANAWANTGSTLPAARHNATTAIVGNMIYMYGGANGSTYTNTIYSAPVSSPTSWTNTGKTLPATTNASQIAVIGNKMYLYGGYNTTTNILVASTSDPTSWTISSNKLPAAMAGQSLTIIGNTMYMFGGGTNGIYSASLSDPTTWTNTGAHLPATVTSGTLVRNDTDMYLIGNFASNTPSKVIYTASLSDPTVWTTATRQFPVATAEGQAVTLGNTIYYISGNGNGTAIYSAPLSDPTSWTTVSGATIPAALNSSSLLAINGNLYLFGGWTTTSSNIIYRAPLTVTATDYYNYPWVSNLPSPVSSVTFGGTNATNIEYLNANTLVATAPAHTMGSVDVAAADSAGLDATLSASYTYVAPPTATSLTPSSTSLAGGDTITVTGSNFASGDTVTVNGVAATSINIVNDTTLTFTAPAGVQIGAVSVIITDSLNQTSDPLTLTYRLPTPTISSISPNAGPSSGGQNITVTGSGFVAPNEFLTTNGNSTTNTWAASSTTLPGTLSNSSLAVIGNTIYMFGGSSNVIYTASTSDPTAWTNTGRTLPGSLEDSRVAIIGNSIYLFGGRNSSVIYTASTSDPLTWTNTGKTLPTTLGWSSFAIIGTKMYLFGGQKSGTTATNVIYSANTSDPTTWTDTGSTIPSALSGSSLAIIGKTIYLFGGNTGSYTGAIYTASTSDPLTWTTSSKTLPTSVGNASLVTIGNSLYLIGGALSSGYANTIYTASTSDPLTWTDTGKTLPGKVEVGSVATINNAIYYFGGYNGAFQKTIYSTPATWVDSNQYNPSWTTNWNTNEYSYKLTLGGTQATNVVATDPTHLTATTAAHAAGAVDAQVTTYDDQTSNTLASGYTYLAPPAVTGITPDSATVSGGTTATITGSGFTSNDTVTVDGNTAVVTQVSSDGTQLDITVPAHAAPGAVQVVVTDELGQSSDPLDFTYTVPAPTIASVSPKYSTMDGGATLTVTGSGFMPDQNGASWYDITIGGMAATNVHQTSSTTLTATIPAHAPGTADVTISGQYVSQPVTLMGGLTYLPDAYAFITNPLSVMAGQPGQFTIELRDANGNPVTSDGSLTLQLDTDTDTGAFASSQDGPWNLATVTVPAGQSSVSVYYHDAVKGQPTITVSDALGTSVSQQETITSRYKLLVTGVTDPTNVGVPSSITVQAVDWNDVPQSSFRGTIAFTSTDGAASLPADYTFTSSDFGRHTFTNGISFGTQGTWAITATETDDTTVTGDQNDIDVGPPAAGTISKLAFTTGQQSFPLDQTSGVITVQMQDSLDDPMVASGPTTIYLRTDSSTGEYSTDDGQTWQSAPAAVTIPANRSSANVLYRDSTAGTHNLKASQNQADDFGWAVAQQPIIVGVGAATDIKLTGPVGNMLPAGNWMPVTVGLSDSSGNSVNAPADTPVHIVIDNGGRLSQASDGTAGNASIDTVVPGGQQSITIYVQGFTSPVTVTATDARPLSEGDTAYGQGSLALNVAAAAPYKVGLMPEQYDSDTQRGIQQVHTTQKVAATLLDMYGNVTLATADTTVSLNSDINTGGTDNTGLFSTSAEGSGSKTLDVTIDNGMSTTDTYYQQTVVGYGVTLSAANPDLQTGSVLDDVTPGPYAGKLLWVNPADSRTSDAALADDPAAFAAFVNPSTQTASQAYLASLKAAAGVVRHYKVYLADQWGNPTTSDEDVTLGIAGSNTSKDSQGNAAAVWGASATGPWRDMVATPTTNTSPVALSTTISAAAATATPSSADVYYKDTIAAKPTISVIDTADSRWSSVCTDYWGATCIARKWTNSSLNAKAITVTAGPPAAYKFVSAAQTISTNTVSAPIVVSLVDQYGNETASDTAMSATISTDSTDGNGQFSLTGTDAWQADSLDLRFDAGVSEMTAYYKDSAVSPVTGYTVSVTGSDGSNSLTAASQKLRTIVGKPDKVHFDLNGVTTTTTGTCVPVQLVTTATVNGSDTEAVVLNDTTFTLTPHATDNGFYINSDCSGSELNAYTMSANTSRAQLYTKFTTAGSKTLQATAAGFTAASTSLDVSASSIYKLGFTTFPTQFTVGRSSSAIAASAEDVYGNIVTTDTDRTVTLSSSKAGEFKSATDADQDSSWYASGDFATVISAGTTTTPGFNYTIGSFDSDGELVDTSVLGTQTITAHTAALSDATEDITATGSTPRDIQYIDDTVTPGSVVTKETVTAGDTITLRLKLLAADGKPAIVNSDTKISLDTLELDGAHAFAAEHGDDVITDMNGAQVSYLTVPAGHATVSFKLQAHTAKDHLVDANFDYYNGSGSNTTVHHHLELDVTASAPDGLHIGSGIQTIHPAISGDENEMSQAINIYLIDKYGNYTSDTSTHDVALSSDCASGHFLSSPTASDPATAVTIGAGSQFTAAWYQDTSAHAGPCTMTFASSGLVSTTQPINVFERVAKLALQSARTVIAGKALSVTVGTEDRFGNTTPVTDQPLTLNFTASGTNNAVVPNSGSIPIGANTATFSFTHTQAVAADTVFTISADDTAQTLPVATQDVTVVPGAPAALAWNTGTSNTYTTDVGTLLPVKLQVVNAGGLATNATENMDIGLSNTAGTNTITGQPAGQFYADAAGTQPISDIELSAGSTETPVFYYQQTTTTHDMSWRVSFDSLIKSDTDYPRTLMASYGSLTSATAQISVKALLLHFANQSGTAEAASSIQARSCKAMTLTVSKAMPFDQTYDLATTVSASEGGFYSSCTTPPGQPDSAMTGQKITRITIPANQTKSAVFYYHQSLVSTFTHLSAVTDPDPAVNAQSWSAFDAAESIATYTGNVTQLKFVDPSSDHSRNPATLAQNQPGTYTIETEDNLGNPVPLLSVDGTTRNTCLYVNVDSTQAALTGSPSQSCPAISGSSVVPLTIGRGQTQVSFTYRDMSTGTHALTVSNSSNGQGSLKVSQHVAITAAQTDHLLFSKATYPLIRGDTVALTIELAGPYSAIVNSLGATSVTLTSPSATGRWLDKTTGNWVNQITVTIPADQTTATVTYRDDSADLGNYTVTAQAEGLTDGTAAVALTTGDFAGLAFDGDPQTLERQQSGTFTINLVDEGGNTVTAATDECLYVTDPSTTAVIAPVQPIDDASSCKDVSLPGGSTAHALLIPAGEQSASFTLKDTTKGTYPITVSANAAQPSADTHIQQNVTIIDGKPVIATLEQESYQMERGDTLSTKVVLRNAYGAIVPATQDSYLKLTSSSASGQFAENTEDPMENTLTVEVPADSTGTNVLYGDSDPQIGTYQITVHHVDQAGMDIADDPLLDSDTPMTLVYGAPTELAFVTDPRTTVATHPSQVMTIELRNQFGYTTVATSDLKLHVASDSSTGEFALSDDGPWGVVTATIPAGSSSASVYYHDSTEGVHQLSVTATLTSDGNTTPLAVTQPHTITKQVMDHFIVTNISTPQQAGTPSSVVVFAVDNENYVVNWYTGTIHFSADTADAVYPDQDYTFTAADKGVHTFTNAIAFKQPGTKAITVTDTQGLTGTQYDIQVGSGNTNPIRSIAFIAPADQPVDALKGTPTDRLILQLRDAAGTPTTPTAADGMPIRLRSDSPTGQFAQSPYGPWSNTLIVTVDQGLSYTTTPIYYQDTSAGQHTITAADWANNIDTPTIQNGTLQVHIAELNLGGQTTLYSEDYSGTMRQNYYLFSHDKNGAIKGYAKSSLTARNTETGDTVSADWLLDLTDGRSKAADHHTYSQQSAIQYTSPTLTPGRSDGNYSLAIDVTAGQLTGSRHDTLPVSTWLARLGNIRFSNDSLQADLLTYNDGNLADAPDGDFILPDLGQSWSFSTLLQNNELIQTTTGTYQINIPLAKPKAGTYQAAVSLHDALGIVAQDASTLAIDVPLPDNPSDPTTSVTPPTTTKPQSPATITPPRHITVPVPHATPKTIATKSQNALKRFLRSPQAPTVVSGALFGILAIIAVILAYQAYKEWQRARRLAAIVKRNNQLVLDKDKFLNLAAHHLRTPITIIRGGAELLAGITKNRSQAVARINALAEHLRVQTEVIVTGVESSPELHEIQEINPHAFRVKVIRSPIFWMPVILSVILTLVANWAIRTFGERTISGLQTLNQIFFLLLGVVIMYTSLRLLYMRREQRRLLTEAEDHILTFNNAKTRFVKQVYTALSDSIIQADGLIEELSQSLELTALRPLNDGVERVKRLLSRFALLDNVYQLTPVRTAFKVDYAVEEALYSLAVEHEDTSNLHITDSIKDIELVQDRHLVSKIFETILGSMQSDTPADITIDGHREKNGVLAVQITGPGTDAPAEDLFSIYSASANENAGTISNDDSVHRLDLYLDRIIVNALGGDIHAEKLGQQMRINLHLPMAPARRA